MRLRQYWYRVLVTVHDDGKNRGLTWVALNDDGTVNQQPIATLAEARKIRTARTKKFGSAIIIRSCISTDPYWKAVVVP